MPELARLKQSDTAALWKEIESRQTAEEDIPEAEIDLTAREYEALIDPSKARHDDPDLTADVIAAPNRGRT